MQDQLNLKLNPSSSPLNLNKRAESCTLHIKASDVSETSQRRGFVCEEESK